MQLEVSIDRDPGRTANDAHHRGVLPSTSSSGSAQPQGYLAACGKNSQLLLVSSNSCPCPLSPWSSTRQFHHLFPRKEICRSSFLVLIILNPLVLTRTLEYYAQLRTRSVLDKSCRRVRPPAWLTQASSMHHFQRPTYSPRTVGRGRQGVAGPAGIIPSSSLCNCHQLSSGATPSSHGSTGTRSRRPP